jgi:transposase-like protein
MKIGQDEILKTDTRGRVRTSRERREAILDDFERSGISGAAYARLHGISYSTFANWVQKRRRRQRREAGKEGRPEPGKATGEPGKLELTLAEITVEKPPSAGPAGKLRVALPGGASLVIADASQAELAAELIRQLEAK